mmetsp:Transcript_15185/g.30912  ORF Transcript_15185/g.30912 Transcript_15185/m.30912 type:complete len:152 (+) Transcript_15185:931-1386(+)
MIMSICLHLKPQLIQSPKPLLVYILAFKLMIGIGEAMRILTLANGLIMLDWKSLSRIQVLVILSSHQVGAIQVHPTQGKCLDYLHRCLQVVDAALLSQGKQIQVCTSQRTVSAHALEQMKKDVPVLLVAALLVVLQRSNEMSVAVALCLSR